MEDAARAYNEHVLSAWEGAKINIVPDTKTTVYDILYRKVLTLEFIKNIETIEEIKTLFFINTDWADEAGIKSVEKLKVGDIESYKKMIYDFKERDIKEEKDPSLKVWSKDPLHRDNITLEYYDSITKVRILRKFFKINKELTKMMPENLDDKNLTLKTFDKYKEAGRVLLIKNMEGRAVNYKSPIPMPDTEDEIPDEVNIRHKDNLTIEYIKSIKTITEMVKIFSTNPDWKTGYKNFKIVSRNMVKRDLDFYKEAAIYHKTLSMK